jgi:hypothetical protein
MIRWAFEILRELGFIYDSGIFPVKSGLWPAAGFEGSLIVQTSGGPLIEFPLPTLEVGSMRAPLGGGAYLRILPYQYTRWAIEYINRRELVPVCVYLHPWELDVDQPRLKAKLTARLRHYVGLRGTEAKFRRLLRDFEFGPLSGLVEQWRANSIHEEVAVREEIPITSRDLVQRLSDFIGLPLRDGEASLGQLPQSLFQRPQSTAETPLWRCG